MASDSEQKQTGSEQGSEREQDAQGQFKAQFGRIKEALGLKHDKELWQLLGVAQGTVGYWKKIKRIPESGLSLLNQKANLSIKWILTGTGPVFTGGSEPDAETPTPDQSASTAPGSPAPALLSSELGEAIQMAVNILQSGTSYAQALLYSIMHFDRALKDAQRIPPLEQEVGDLKKALMEMQGKLYALQKDYCERIASDESLGDQDIPEICRQFKATG